MVAVKVELLEDRLEALVGKELLLVDTDHHEFVQRDQTITGAISHSDQVVDSLFVKVSSKVLPVSIDQLNSGEGTVTGSIQVSEDLLKLDGVVHVQEMLDEVAEGGLLGGILARERSQVGKSASDTLVSLMDGTSGVVLLFEATHVVEPRVLESFSGRDSDVFFTEDARDQVLNFIRDFVPSTSFHAVLTRLDFLNDLLISLTVKGRFAREQDVKDNTDTPNITLLAVSTLDDFRGDIVRCSEDSVHGVFVVDTAGSTEINELDDSVLLVLEMDVLRLDISMHDVVLV